MAELEASERALSVRVGELSGQLVAARDLVERLEEERDRARGETLRLAAQLSAFETRVEGLRRGYEHRIALLASEFAPGLRRASPRAPTKRIERELARVREDLAGLRGERDGLRLRLKDREAALAVALARRAAMSPQMSPEELDQASRRGGEPSSLERRAATAFGRPRQPRRTSPNSAPPTSRRSSRVATRSVRLNGPRRRADGEAPRRQARAGRQVGWLREAVVDASSAVDAKERCGEAPRRPRCLRSRRPSAVARRRTWCAKSSCASKRSRRDAHARTSGELATLRERAERAGAKLGELRETAEGACVGRRTRAADRARRETVEAHATEVAAARAEMDARVGAREEALAEMRTGLSDLRRLLDGWRVEEGAARRRAEITEVGLEAPEMEDARVVRLEREVDDKDTLLRSLTAQLEERDDRLRALERRLAEQGPAGDSEDVRRELLELQERVARLHDELTHERQARGLAEEQVEDLRRRPAAEEEVARLERSLRERDAALREATSRAGAFERDVESLRGVFLQAREGLEALLGSATDRGDPRTAERIGELLGVLGRFS
ncbi:MAG: hypothetical protein R3B99_02305 [Polyangiales bacterium]